MTTNQDNIHTKKAIQDLYRLGWNSFFQQQLENLSCNEMIPARVAGVRKTFFLVSDGKKEQMVTIAGKLKHQAGCLYPATGDWVLINETVISVVLERKNALSRGAAGTHGKQDALPQKEQVIAANLDTVFIVCGLDRDFNLSRLERCLTLVYNCGLDPAIILTKADLHQDAENYKNEAEEIGFGVPVHLVSALDSKGLDTLKKYVSPGKTVTMIGSSGAGKSTLVNRLYGKTVQATASISESVGKGIHTTTTRDLIMMPQGGMMIDNPGIREIAFWNDDAGIGAAFPEIEILAGECRFYDCSHMQEPGCRVLQAVSNGEISLARLESYQKMKRELDYLSNRQYKSADRVEKERWQHVALKVKAMKKGRRNKP
jgi:ribosome biogenesis GTPase